MLLCRCESHHKRKGEDDGVGTDREAMLVIRRLGNFYLAKSPEIAKIFLEMAYIV